MTAELFEGNVLRVTLSGRAGNLPVLEQLLGEAPGVSGYTIDASNTLTAYLTPRGELEVVRAIIASGMYPLETLDPETTVFGGGHRAC